MFQLCFPKPPPSLSHTRLPGLRITSSTQLCVVCLRTCVAITPKPIRSVQALSLLRALTSLTYFWAKFGQLSVPLASLPPTHPVPPSDSTLACLPRLKWQETVCHRQCECVSVCVCVCVWVCGSSKEGTWKTISDTMSWLMESWVKNGRCVLGWIPWAHQPCLLILLPLFFLFLFNTVHWFVSQPPSSPRPSSPLLFLHQGSAKIKAVAMETRHTILHPKSLSLLKEGWWGG